MLNGLDLLVAFEKKPDNPYHPQAIARCATNGCFQGQIENRPMTIMRVRTGNRFPLSARSA